MKLSNIKKYNFQYFLILISIIILFIFSTGCENTQVFCKRVIISAMPEKIFKVITDFESYPKLCPEFYKQVNIVSNIKEGKGVIIENVSEFKGYSQRSRWEVIEYEKDKLIRLENPSFGTIIMIVNQIDYNTSEEIMIVVTKISSTMKDEVFSVYEKQMKAVKEKCERM